MHDLNEGVCRYVMGFIINTFIYKEERFSLDFFNSRLAGINYITDYSATPCLSEEQVKSNYLTISSSEMIFLIEHFGLLVGDRIPKDSKIWKLYLYLADIMYLVYSESFNEETYDKLDKTIAAHHKCYMKLSGKHLIVKFHNLLHMTRLIKQMGPSRFFSSIRFEGRHKDFKEYSDVTNNQINSPHSLALKNQLTLSYRFMLNEGFTNRLILGKKIGNTRLKSRVF